MQSEPWGRRQCGERGRGNEESVMRWTAGTHGASDAVRGQPGGHLTLCHALAMNRTGVEGTESGVPEQEPLMGNGTDVGTAARAIMVRESRRAAVTGMKVASACPLSLEIVAMSLGCFLVATLCIAVLSRVAPGPVMRASEAPIEREIQLDAGVPTIYEIEGGGLSTRVYPAFAL